MYAAYHVIPQDAKGDDELGLRATVQMQLGKYYQKRLEVGIALYAEGQEFDQEKVSKKEVEFPELKMNWPVIKNVTSLDDAKTIFKLANTQYKKSLEYYILDGYVTEHVNIKQGMCSLYKALTRIELNVDRRVLMHERRVEMVEYLKG